MSHIERTLDVASQFDAGMVVGWDRPFPFDPKFSEENINGPKQGKYKQYNMLICE